MLPFVRDAGLRFDFSLFIGISFGSAASVKEKGLLRIEGKDYGVRDGDVMLFRFNV